MIEQETIDRIKTGVDIKDLITSKGIHLKKNGKGYFGLCPFHNDKNPSLSVTPSKNEWHCFGCGKGGDVIRFIELFDQVDFKEAIKRLASSAGTSTAVKEKTPPKPAMTFGFPLSARHKAYYVYFTQCSAPFAAFTACTGLTLPVRCGCCARATPCLKKMAGFRCLRAEPGRFYMNPRFA